MPISALTCPYRTPIRCAVIEMDKPCSAALHNVELRCAVSASAYPSGHAVYRHRAQGDDRVAVRCPGGS